MPKAIRLLTGAGVAALLAGLLAPAPARACGPDPTLGSVCFFAFPFCPSGYVMANGATVPNNQALYSLFGNAFGPSPDNKSSTVVPNLQGVMPVGTGPNRNGASNSVSYAQQLGSDGSTLMALNINHLHPFEGTISIPTPNVATTASANSPTPEGNYLASDVGYYNDGEANYRMNSVLRVRLPPIPYPVPPGPAPGSLAIQGAPTGQANPTPMPLRPPQMALTACIAVSGMYPQRP